MQGVRRNPRGNRESAGGSVSDQQSEHYLGDGLYVRVDLWGAVCLRAPRAEGDHVVCLEPPVLAEFERWLKHLRKARHERQRELFEESAT